MAAGVNAAPGVNIDQIRAMIGPHGTVQQIPNTQCLDQAIGLLGQPVNPHDQVALNDQADLMECLVLLMHAKLKNDKVGYQQANAKLEKKIEDMTPRLNAAIAKQNPFQGELDKVAAKLNEIQLAYAEQQKRLERAEAKVQLYEQRERNSFAGQMREMGSEVLVLPNKVVWNITAFFTGKGYW
jgi:hypothetical protein